MSPHPNCSLAEWLSLLSAEEQAEALASLSEEQSASLLHDWRGMWARPNQLPPGSPGAAIQRSDWRYWVVQAGRGFGKTRIGAETVREWAQDPNERILMIAPVAADVREVMIEGPSGLMNCYPPQHRPLYNPSRHLVTFPSGAIGITRSADEPERLRGPQFTKFWADEFCAWTYHQEAWDQIMFGFRLPTPHLRGLITTTPKPLESFRKIIKNPGTVVTRGSSYENRLNLSESYYQDVIAPYEGTRLGRQEINAELLEDLQGALWTRAMIDAARITLSQVPPLVRVVVAIDPAVTAGETSDEVGLGAAGVDWRGHVYVLQDCSRRATVNQWVYAALRLLLKWEGDRVVAEVNNGGDLVGHAIHSVNENVPFRSVRASRGKMVRAEPVSALYEQGRVHHVHGISREDDEQMCGLEDQLTSWVPGVTKKSPDRMDWLVWAVHDLVLDRDNPQRFEMPPTYQISAI